MANVLSITGGKFNLRIEYDIGPNADDLLDSRDTILADLLSSFREMNGSLVVKLCRMQKVDNVYTIAVIKRQGDELVFDTDHVFIDGQIVRVVEGHVVNLLASDIELIQSVRTAMVAIVDKYKATLIEFVGKP